MYRKEGKEGEVIIGVLNDWDLAIDMQSNPQHHGLERTGTAPFMAQVDLLLNRQGQIQHLYRHDHEATLWIATWVFLCYANGKYVGNTHDPCRRLKWDFLGTLARQKPQKEWKAEWVIIAALLRDLRLAHILHDEERMIQQENVHEEQPYQPTMESDDPDHVLRQQWATIERVAAKNPELGYVLRYKPDFEVERSSGPGVCGAPRSSYS
ncbi:hypothetical protein K474DRAFT_1661952 [Panus rudis PR-1116 ss-1]|nr:hypothetical protein K474DRAFT_1661952 [Panus rudis PR-1116 ss-1]